MKVEVIALLLVGFYRNGLKLQLRWLLVLLTYPINRIESSGPADVKL